MSRFAALTMILLGGVASVSAADRTVNNLPASPAITDSQLVYCPLGSAFDYKCTFTQIATYIKTAVFGPTVTIITPSIPSTDMSVPINAALAGGGTKVQLTCGTYYTSNVISWPNNSEIQGSGDCTIIKANANLASNPQAVNIPGGDPNGHEIIANADFTNGNQNFHLHDLVLDQSQVAYPKILEAALFVGSSNIHVDHVHCIGSGTMASGGDCLASIGSFQFAWDHNTEDGSYQGAAYDIWSGSHDFTVTENVCNGAGVNINCVMINGLSSAATAMPCQNGISCLTYNGVVAHNISHNTFSVAYGVFGLCTSKWGPNICGRLRNIVLDHNISDTSVFAGIDVGDADEVTLVGNQVKNINGVGITVASQAAATYNTQSFTVQSSGTGNAIGDLLTLGGGGLTCTTYPVLKVTAIVPVLTATINVVTGVGQGGSCSVVGSNPIGVTATTGSGSGATFNLTMALLGQTSNVNVIGNTIDNANSASSTSVALGVGNASDTPTNVSLIDNNIIGTHQVYATRIFPGALNTIFQPGAEDAGTSGTDIDGGTNTSKVAFQGGNNTWTGTNVFSVSPALTQMNYGAAIQSATGNYNTLLYGSPGNEQYYAGSGKAGEVTFGVANDWYIYDITAAAVRLKIDLDGNLITPPVAIAALPTCASSNVGAKRVVNNAQTSPTYGGAVSTTGSYKWGVQCSFNGSVYSWVYD